MADGKIVIAVDADAKKAQKELDTLSAKIDKMEAKLNEDTGTQNGLKKELDAALQSAKQTEDALKSLRSEADRADQRAGTAAGAAKQNGGKARESICKDHRQGDNPDRCA